MIEFIDKIFCEDNLLLLKRIPENSLSLIYSDILYGTGRNFGEYQDLPLDREIITTHYEPRLSQMRKVLSERGLIYLQMDSRISHWMRFLLDDIFGIKNFRNEIIWSYNSAPRKKNDFGSRHDTILRYSKSDSYTFNPIREPYSPTAPRGYEKEKFYHAEGKVIGDVWNINILGQNDKTERVGYPTQKPLSLAERIIKSSSNEGDTVADFYCGSGTTLVAAKKLNRQFLGCDLSQKAVGLSKQRLNAI